MSGLQHVRVQRPSRIRKASRPGRPSKLRALMRDMPEVYQRMLATIRAGAFACVAAQIAGIAPETFSRWLDRGRRERRGPFRRFRQDVQQAIALARADAEIQVCRDNPVVWLRLGPGRSRDGLPGWTDRADQSPTAGKPPQSPLTGLGPERRTLPAALNDGGPWQALVDNPGLNAGACFATLTNARRL